MRKALELKSFTPNEKQDSEYTTQGTAVVIVNGTEHVLNARTLKVGDYEWVKVSGFACRIGRTGAKAWQSEAVFNAATLNFNRFNVLGADRLTHRGVFLIGMWDAMPEARRCQR